MAEEDKSVCQKVPCLTLEEFNTKSLLGHLLQSILGLLTGAFWLADPSQQLRRVTQHMMDAQSRIFGLCWTQTHGSQDRFPSWFSPAEG